MSAPWREVELNPRPPVQFANRCATYASPVAIEIRFLHTFGMRRSRIGDGEEDLVELQNGPHVALPLAMALQLIADLQRSVAQYEKQMGKIATAEELNLMWSGDHLNVNG